MLAKGKIFFRDTGAVSLDRKQFILIGNLWVPGSVAIKPEHAYILLGSQIENEGLPVVSLQVLINSSEDLTNEAKKKHPSQIIPLIHTAHP